jgi:hypothetical protein
VGDLFIVFCSSLENNGTMKKTRRQKNRYGTCNKTKTIENNNF